MYTVRGNAYRLAMERAIVSVGKDETCFDDQSEGWIQAASLSKNTYAMRPPEPLPDGFDIEEERRRAIQGGCCGQPQPNSFSQDTQAHQ